MPEMMFSPLLLVLLLVLFVVIFLAAGFGIAVAFRSDGGCVVIIICAVIMIVSAFIISAILKALVG